MQFVVDKDNGLYKIVRITGPSHNFLAFKITTNRVIMNVIPLVKDGDISISKEDVYLQVQQGFNEINKEKNIAFFISEAHFIPSDTYSKNVYKTLTVELIKRIYNYFETQN